MFFFQYNVNPQDIGVLIFFGRTSSILWLTMSWLLMSCWVFAAEWVSAVLDTSAGSYVTYKIFKMKAHHQNFHFWEMPICHSWSVPHGFPGIVRNTFHVILSKKCCFLQLNDILLTCAGMTPLPLNEPLSVTKAREVIIYRHPNLWWSLLSE